MKNIQEPKGVPLHEIVTALWKKACEYDNIPLDSKFVVFSADNAAARLYSAAVLKLFAV